MTERAKMPGRLRTILVSAVIVGLIAIAALALRDTRSTGDRASQLDPTPPPMPTETDTPKPTKATSTPSTTTTATSTAAPSPSATAASQATRVADTDRTGTATPMPTASQTPTATPTPSPSPTRTSTPMNTATPTPIACTDLGGLGDMQIAPGQRFRCVVNQGQITSQLKDVPNLPCSEAGVTFDDHQFTFVCQMQIKITVSGGVETNNCQLDVTISTGTIGFAQAAQLMINAMLPNLPYERFCFDQIQMDDGEMELSGYGR